MNVPFRAVICALALLPMQPARENAARVTAVRLTQNPLITVDASPSLGDNDNGPSVIRVPSWIPHPLGRYYAYFGHHKGRFIRLAYADAITGPWKVYEPGVLPVSETTFYRPQPDPPDGPVDQFYTHVASPEIYIDEARQRLVLWTHGWWTDGERWPLGMTEARAWARANGYGRGLVRMSGPGARAVRRGRDRGARAPAARSGDLRGGRNDLSVLFDLRRAGARRC
jgi:hypothetical protein